MKTSVMVASRGIFERMLALTAPPVALQRAVAAAAKQKVATKAYGPAKRKRW